MITDASALEKEKEKRMKDSRKEFFDVFKDIELDRTVGEYFTGVVVTGVALWKDARKLSVDIESTHLISRQFIRVAESAIAKLVFGDERSGRVEISERFLLSGQYTTEKIMELYFDSMLYELRDKSNIEYHLI